MLRPISSITPACRSEVAKLPPLITMMSLPGCDLSLPHELAGVARDELGALVRDRRQRAREDVALDAGDRRVVRAAPLRRRPLPGLAAQQQRVGLGPRLPHDLLDVLAEVQPVDAAVAVREVSRRGCTRRRKSPSAYALLWYTKRRFRNDTKPPFINCQPPDVPTPAKSHRRRHLHGGASRHVAPGSGRADAGRNCRGRRASPPDCWCSGSDRSAICCWRCPSGSPAAPRDVRGAAARPPLAAGDVAGLQRLHGADGRRARRRSRATSPTCRSISPIPTSASTWRSTRRRPASNCRSSSRKRSTRESLSPSTNAKQLARTIEAVVGGSMMSWAFYQEGAAAKWMRHDLDAVLKPYLS